MAWENLHGTELEEAVYTYTKKVLCALKEADAMPDMVQIGNEIRSGLLFPDPLCDGFFVCTHAYDPPCIL